MARNTKGVAAFLVLAFGLAWIVWETPIWLGLSVHDRLFQLAVIPGAFAPAIAALVVRKWVTREGFADAGLTLGKPSFYLLAWLIPLLVVGFVVFAAPALGWGEPDLSLRGGGAIQLPAARALAAQLPQGALLAAVLRFTVVSLAATPILWGEEFGWRSYLQMRLFGDRPLLAAIATGLIWGVWHFPLLLRGGELPAHPYVSLAIFPLGTILYSIIFGWIRQASGSVWASSFAHSAINNLRSPLIMLLFASQADLLPIALLGLAALAILAGLIVLAGQLKPIAQTAVVKAA